MSPVPPPPTIVIALATYRRNDELAATLPQLLDQLGTVPNRTRILVVDNDPDGGACPVLQQLDDVRVAYHHEPAPGIAAARNRALREAATDDVLIFIDDDETPRAGWLAGLVSTYDVDRPAAVVGPVVSEFDGPLEDWIAAGGYFERRRLPTGTPIETAATNNLLLDLGQVRAAGLTFDPAFGLTGGSDTLFTRQLTRRGLRMIWCNEAIVVDHVPADRATRQWVTRRAMRYGNSWSRTSIALAAGPRQRLSARLRMTAGGAARVGGGAGRLVLGHVSRSVRHQARGTRTMMKGIGYMRGAVGSIYTEYARPASAPRPNGSALGEPGPPAQPRASRRRTSSV